MSTDFDIEDVFGDLDDIEQAIEELDSETLFDRHDRLKAAYEDAQEAGKAARNALVNIAGSKHPTGSADRFFHDSRLDWNGRVWNATEFAVDSFKAGFLRFKDTVPDEVQAEVCEAIQACVDAKAAEEAASAAYQPVRKEALEQHFTEGCFVTWQDKRGDWNAYTGYGTVVQVTASNYVVRIDHDEIRRTCSYADRDHFGSKENALLKVDACQLGLGYANGGRSARLVWGPKGNAARAERAAAAKARKEAEEAARQAEEAARYEREQAARLRCQAAQSAWQDAEATDRDHHAALSTAPQQAAEAALEVIKAKYARELAALTATMTHAITESLADYERPAILDGPRPSADWRDYLEGT